MRMRIGLYLLLLVSLPVGAQSYRWTDPQTGRTVVSDTPPPPHVGRVQMTWDTSPNVEGYTFAVRRAVALFPVTLFTYPDCPPECQQARELLDSRGIPFTERVLQTKEEFDTLARLVGQPFFPSLQVGREMVRGFNMTQYNNVLDWAGYPTSAPPGRKPSSGSNQ